MIWFLNGKSTQEIYNRIGFWGDSMPSHFKIVISFWNISIIYNMVQQTTCQRRYRKVVLILKGLMWEVYKNIFIWLSKTLRDMVDEDVGI